MGYPVVECVGPDRLLVIATLVDGYGAVPHQALLQGGLEVRVGARLGRGRAKAKDVLRVHMGIAVEDRSKA